MSAGIPSFRAPRVVNESGEAYLLTENEPMFCFIDGGFKSMRRHMEWQFWCREQALAETVLTGKRKRAE